METRPVSQARPVATASLNGVRLAITNLDPIPFARVLRKRRLKRDPRRERLEKAEAELKAARQ